VFVALLLLAATFYDEIKLFIINSR